MVHKKPNMKFDRSDSKDVNDQMMKLYLLITKFIIISLSVINIDVEYEVNPTSDNGNVYVIAHVINR